MSRFGGLACAAVLVSCGSNMTASGTEQPLHGRGFHLTLPAGWSQDLPALAVQGGFTNYALHPPSAAVRVTVGYLQIPANTADPLVEAAAHEDIAVLALSVNGAGIGSTNIAITDAVHRVSVAGENCAGFAQSFSSQGQAVSNRTVTCRHAGTIYSLIAAGAPGVAPADLQGAIDTLVRSWAWDNAAP